PYRGQLPPGLLDPQPQRPADVLAGQAPGEDRQVPLAQAEGTQEYLGGGGTPAEPGQVEAEYRRADQAVHARQAATRPVLTAWGTSTASISRPSSLTVLVISSRVGPVSVSGGGSKSLSSTSITSPIRSTSRLTGS